MKPQYELTDLLINRLIDWPTAWLTDRQTDRQTDLTTDQQENNDCTEKDTWTKNMS